MSKLASPLRLQWAVDVLAVQTDEKLLEIGCGRGVALRMICEHLQGGHVTGIDRSATATAVAAARNHSCIEAGKASLVTSELAAADLNDHFDKIFAVNVNVFWLGPEKELAVIRRVLAPRGRLYLFYEPPSATQRDRALEACSRNLREGGFAVIQVLHTALASNLSLGIIAERRTA